MDKNWFPLILRVNKERSRWIVLAKTNKKQVKEPIHPNRLVEMGGIGWIGIRAEQRTGRNGSINDAK